MSEVARARTRGVTFESVAALNETQKDEERQRIRTEFNTSVFKILYTHQDLLPPPTSPYDLTGEIRKQIHLSDTPRINCSVFRYKLEDGEIIYGATILAYDSEDNPGKYVQYNSNESGVSCFTVKDYGKYFSKLEEGDTRSAPITTRAVGLSEVQRVSALLAEAPIA